MRRLVLLAGSSHPQLAELIAKRLNCPMTRALRGKYANGEIRFELQDSVRGADVFVLQTHCFEVNDMFMEMLIMVQTCRYAAADRITAVLPLFPYARQDKMHHLNQPISAKLVANMLSSAGVQHVLTLNLHAAQLQGFFDIPCENLGPEVAIIPWIKANLPDWECMIIVAPDNGAVKSANSISEQLKLPFAMLHKERRKPGEVHNMMLFGDVAGKSAIVVDDMADTCHTLCFTAQRLRDAGAKKLYAIITHGVFSGDAVARLNESQFELIICTNTLPQPPSVLNGNKFRIIDISHIFEQSIANMHDNDGNKISKDWKSEHQSEADQERRVSIR